MSKHLRCPFCNHCLGFTIELMPEGLNSFTCAVCRGRFKYERQPSKIVRAWRRFKKALKKASDAP